MIRCWWSHEHQRHAQPARATATRTRGTIALDPIQGVGRGLPQSERAERARADHARRHHAHRVAPLARGRGRRAMMPKHKTCGTRTTWVSRIADDGDFALLCWCPTCDCPLNESECDPPTLDPHDLTPEIIADHLRLMRANGEDI